jgi:D-hydroxyproline dehydrogenase subunit beta
LPDAIVLGAGICGASAAYFLAERGLEVVVLDRTGVGQETSSKGEGNVLVCDKPPGVEREIQIHGRRLWMELGARFPAGRVTRKGSLLLFDGPGGEDVSSIEPALAPGITALLDVDDLQVDPPGMVRALLDGIPVRTGVTATAASAHTVTLDSGEQLSADHIVLAPGPWAGELTGLPIEPRKGQLVELAAPPKLIEHKLIEAAYMDAVADEDAGLVVATVVEQTLNGDAILVGSSRLRVGFDATVDPAVTDAMLARAARFVPALGALTVRRAWCGFRPWLPDHVPAIGRLQSGAWTSTGHEGSGVGLGPVSGLLLAQMICGEALLIDPEPFNPCRFGS